MTDTMRGDGRVFLRGNVWWIAYCGPGTDGLVHEIRESSGSDSEAAARKLLRDRLREVANHRHGIRAFEGPSAERLTVRELLESLKAEHERRGIKSLKKTQGHAKPVIAFFADYRAMAVNAAMISRYIEMRRTDGRSNATINRELEVLAAAFTLAVRQERIVRRPHVAYLPENNARKGFFERDEHERILQHLKAPADDIARFAYRSGWRREEIRTLRWENIDRAAREVRIYDSKNGEGRVLPLDDDLWGMFERLWSSRQQKTRSGAVILSEYVFHRRGRAISDTRLKVAWMEAREKAGLPGKLFHDYRRTAVRNMIRAGVPQAVAMAITGHRTDSMFRRYNIVTTKDQLEALRKTLEHDSANDQKTSNVTEFRRDEK